MANDTQLKRISNFLDSIHCAQEAQAFILEVRSSAFGMGVNNQCINQMQEACSTNKTCTNYGNICDDSVNENCTSQLPIIVDTNDGCPLNPFPTCIKINEKECK